MSIKENGFTLVEFILTILIIGIVAVFVIPVFSNIFAGVFSAGDKTKATFEAQQLIVNSLVNKSEDGDLSNNITMTLVGKDDNSNIFTNIDVEKRSQTVEYKLPKNVSRDLTLLYYIYLPDSP